MKMMDSPKFTPPEFCATQYVNYYFGDQETHNDY